MREPLLQWAMLELMDALTDDIIRIEATANELVSATVELSGKLNTEALRDAARRHRVDALVLRGQLAALRQECAEWFPRKL